MSITDYPTPSRIVDSHGRIYRLQFRSPENSHPTTGQLVAVTDGDTEAPPIALTKDRVHQADVDTELGRWIEWPSVIRSDGDDYWSELSLIEVQRRFANADLQPSTDKS